MPVLERAVVERPVLVQLVVTPVRGFALAGGVADVALGIPELLRVPTLRRVTATVRTLGLLRCVVGDLELLLGLGEPREPLDRQP